MSCPVDHSNAKEPCNPADNCPVDHNKRTTLATLLSSSTDTASQKALSQNRVVSSIPRNDEGHWVYPSESQFFAAMARKNHNPEASDMRTIVPIHNAVNERTWSEVMEWEKGRGGEKCGGVKLVTFKGRPGDMSPKARWKCLLGYAAPFDRHDWVVDRCGTRVRYVIDFYTGRSATNGVPNKNLSFYLDVRPALDSWEGILMRAGRLFTSWFGDSKLANSERT